MSLEDVCRRASRSAGSSALRDFHGDDDSMPDLPASSGGELAIRELTTIGRGAGAGDAPEVTTERFL